MSDKQYVVIGLGIFGSTIATTLSEAGKEVLAIDRDMICVERLADVVTKAVVADGTDIDQLKMLGVQEFDVAIVAIGDKLEASILTVMNLKELGVKRIVAKARNKQFMQILYKVGADEVVRPERDMGEKIAKRLLRNRIVDLVELDGGYSVVEMRAPSMWVGQSIKQLNIRAKYDFNIIGIKKAGTGQLMMSINPDALIHEDDQFVLVANTKNIENFDLISDK
jgi:trk system potassium uptake protein TrkA